MERGDVFVSLLTPIELETFKELAFKSLNLKITMKIETLTCTGYQMHDNACRQTRDAGGLIGGPVFRDHPAQGEFRDRKHR